MNDLTWIQTVLQLYKLNNSRRIRWANLNVLEADDMSS